MVGLYEKFGKILNYNNILKDEPMKNHTSFKIGGQADWLLLPQNTEQIVEIINICKSNEIPYIVIGNGSNILVKDTGYRGVIIKFSKQFSEITVSGTAVTAQSGAALPAVAAVALKHSLKGFEFASGIPGSIGGGLFMNAGAYGSELGGIVAHCEAINPYSGEMEYLSVDEMDMSYRHSIFCEKSSIIISATFTLSNGDESEIRGLMNDLNNRRILKQPINLPSAGSFFKRPQGYFAAKLIEDSGLKGYAVGGARISEKHSGFIVNTGNATADDVLRVMEHCIDIVWREYHVTLEPEVRIIG